MRNRDLANTGRGRVPGEVGIPDQDPQVEPRCSRELDREPFHVALEPGHAAVKQPCVEGDSAAGPAATAPSPLELTSAGMGSAGSRPRIAGDTHGTRGRDGDLESSRSARALRPPGGAAPNSERRPPPRASPGPHCTHEVPTPSCLVPPDSLPAVSSDRRTSGMGTGEDMNRKGRRGSLKGEPHQASPLRLEALLMRLSVVSLAAGGQGGSRDAVRVPDARIVRRRGTAPSPRGVTRQPRSTAPGAR